MATWGVTDPTGAAFINTGGHAGKVWVSGGPIAVAGTITAIDVYARGNSATTNQKFAIYNGGDSDTNPNNATKVAELTTTTAISTLGWKNYSLSGTFSSGRLWIVALMVSGTDRDTYEITAADSPSRNGDLTYQPATSVYLAQQGTAETTLPATFATTSLTALAGKPGPIVAKLTYTEGGASAVPILASTYYRMLGS